MKNTDFHKPGINKKDQNRLGQTCSVKEPTRLENRRREMKVKEKKYLPFFPGVEKNPSREKVSEQENQSPGRLKTRGKRQGKKRQGKTTGVKGDTIFYSQSES